jgi:hypothetical protein
MKDAAHRSDGDRLLGVEGGDSCGDLGVSTREGSLVTPLLETLGRGDFAIMDRGFPARWLLAMLVDPGIDVVMRMTAAEAGSWPEVVEFLASGSKSAVISCNLSKGRSVTVRLVRKNARLGRPKKHLWLPFILAA